VIPPLEEFLAHELFSTLDRHLARQIATVAGAQSRLAGHAAALASAMLRRGHVCVDLRQPPQFNDEVGLPTMPWPQIAEWRGDLLASGVVASDGRDFKPLVLDTEGRLYLHRYDAYERRLATAIGRRAEAGRFRVIVGGPGTGKTTRILAELVALAVREPAPRIELAAPTGKAAQRMEESIAAGLGRLTLDAATLARIPRSASTLHRLLGARSDSAFFRHNASRPLPADVVIVDEASMVDLPLMAKLLDALHADAEVILVGDPDQLASVEAGTVLADIVAGSPENRITRLTIQHRFKDSPNIVAAAAAIRDGDVDATFAAISNSGPDVRWVDSVDAPDLAAEVLDLVVEHAQHVMKLASDGQISDALALKGELQVLCAHRNRKMGVAGWNRVIEERLGLAASNQWYVGRPIIVTENDRTSGLFNGDVAVVGADGSRRVACFSTDPAKSAIPVTRLPNVETVHALTIHKSQGSEYDHVIVVLPEHQSRILTRELLYTGVTRAKQRLTVIGPREAIQDAVARPIRRATGLAVRLIHH